MATSKTLSPTGVTIQIPAFTDQPDQRVNSNCIDKEADAINALSDQIANVDIKSSFTLGANVLNTSKIYKNGKFVYLSLAVSSLANNDVLVSNLGTYLPIYNCIGAVVKSSDGKPVSGSAWAEASSGKITYYGDAVSQQCAISMVYLSA